MIGGPLRRWHRRLGLVIGLPCLLWGLSGAVLAWKHHTSRRPPGDAARVAGPPTPFVVPIERALLATGHAEAPTSVEWRWLLGRPRYEIHYAAAPELAVIDGQSGQLLPPADEDLARRVALADAPSGATVASVDLVQQPSRFAYRPGRDLPVYRVALTNGSDVYVSHKSGQVQAHVDWVYRLLRVAFFALHLWDLSLGPEPHRSFLLLGAAALMLLLLGASGLSLAFCGSARRRGPP